MTDDRSTPSDAREPGDGEHEDVSRLLAAAAAEERLPADVSARLDSVLADLVSERAAAAGTTTERTAGGDPETVTGVTLLETRRRRRWPGLLVAAAAVSVLGLGVGNLLGGQGSGGDAMTADSGAGGVVDSGEESDVGSLRTDEDAEAPQAEVGPPTVASEWPPRLRTASLADDVRRVVADVPVERRALTGEEEAADWCVRPALSPGDEALPVRLDGRRAVLVLREAADGRRTAEVFTCDDGDTPAASTTVPAP